MNPQSFIAKWRNSTLNEKAFYQSHFNDLCALIEHPNPIEMDPHGAFFRFEAGASKSSGGQGFADVWYKDHFAWEYKGKESDLEGAYQQLLRYHDALDNPPLLIVSDWQTIIIRTKITNSPKREFILTLDDLARPEKLAILRAAFFNPLSLKAEQTTEDVTEGAAKEFAKIAQLLYKYGEEPQAIAHFLIRILFCLFSEDVGLLPGKIFSKILLNSRTNTRAFSAQLKLLFEAMSTGGWFGADQIRNFDGHLFDDANVLDMDSDSLEILWQVSGLDWGQIKPSIFGTLFERSLDPSKRAQLGAHYTSEDDILLIVEPVLMAPLRRRWEEIQQQARQLAAERDAAASRQAANKHQSKLTELLVGFTQELAKIRVLDAACGSGNFLYVALRQLLDLWKEVSVFAARLGIPYMAPLQGYTPHPSQLFGIELNEYAQQLAQATIWIGYIQWSVENGYGFPPEPILSKLENIECKDAILAFDEQGEPVEPEWPDAEVIIGNPPFLGVIKQRSELGEEYLSHLSALYKEYVPAKSDLVCYWFMRAMDQILKQKTHRVGLIATQAIRKGLSRTVLDRIKECGDIFSAYSDRPWILDGAAVRVSIICFDNGSEKLKILDSKEVSTINPDLSSMADLTMAVNLRENDGVVFPGTKKYGAFDIDAELASELLSAKGNPNGRPNSDVVKPWVNGSDLVRRRRGKWIIDFGVDTPIELAASYELPFNYVKKVVKPSRDKERDIKIREHWWLFERPRPELRTAIIHLNRYIGTPVVSKHRLFVWLENPTIPDAKVTVFAREDDYFFGVLHSSLHEVWSLANGAKHGVGNDPTYNTSTCFETFPFPWPPGQEVQDDLRVQAIAQAAKELVEKRDAWLNPPGANEAELKKRTLTNLYNQRPTWLDLAHKKLDEAVFAAYGWPADLSDDEILARLLALNLERARG